MLDRNPNIISKFNLLLSVRTGGFGGGRRVMTLMGSFLEIVVVIDVDSYVSSSMAGEVGLGMCISRDIFN